MTQGFLFDPTDDQRRLVRTMSGFGIPHTDIATYLRIDAKTLRKHFRDELDLGSIEATTKVAQSLFRAATELGSVAAMIFWMKARAGWREKHELELTGKDGGPVAVMGIMTDDPMVAAREYQRIISGNEG
jgi:hypothetical protein